MTKVITCLFLYLSLQVSAFSWWDGGHMVVAEIAYEELDSTVKEKVDRYLAAVSLPFPAHSNFVSSSVWADDISAEGLKVLFSWHGSAKVYDPSGILTAAQVKEINDRNLYEKDTVWAIKHSVKTLGNETASDWAKGFMLRMLIHIVGDIHQPLHNVTRYNVDFPNGDRAGTRFLLEGKHKSLHSLWDSVFEDAEIKPARPMTESDSEWVRVYASQIKSAYSRASLLAREEMMKPVGMGRMHFADQWSKESYDLALEYAYPGIEPNAEPSEEYMARGREVAREQLAIAAYRLADLLNAILSE